MPYTRSGKNTFGESPGETRKQTSKKRSTHPTNTPMQVDNSIETPSDISSLKRRPFNENPRDKTNIKSSQVPKKELDKPQSHPPQEAPASVETNPANSATPKRNKTTPCKGRFTFKLNLFSITIILITSVLLATLIFLWNFDLYQEIIITHRPTSTKFRDCVSELKLKFPDQDPLLWRQIVKNYNFNQERRRTVMCQTFITHRANRHPLDCLIRKLSKCLDERDPYIFIPVSDPIHSASLLERDLNSTDREVGYFREITDLTHPIPTVFHAICDPDHSPYKERVFFFTISTDSLTNKSGEYTHRDISNSISEVLNKYWETELFPPEQIAAVISRIADTAYYFQKENNTIKC